MKRSIVLLMFLMSWIGFASASDSVAPSNTAAKTDLSRAKMTADHSQFEQLNQDFDYAPDVTEACLECHTEAAKQVHKTFHWNWSAKITKLDIGNGETLDNVNVGKGENGINNYCVAAKGNTACAQCHIGYGMRNEDFDFEEETNVDCLVCHDGTGTYKKSGAMSGHPYYEDTKLGDFLQPAIDLKAVAMSVGAPKRENCLTCHANGGGGNGVKHGDIDMSLVDPVHELDVHMSDKLNFTCQTCHSTSGHEISGRYNGKKAFLDHEKDMGRMDRDGKNVSCESCHGQVPHEERELNNHTTKVACTSCHIPEMARGGTLTKLSWDWSTATKMDENGKPYKVDKEFDGIEAHSYMSMKGDFTWGQNVVPKYRWYKGELKPATMLTVIDPTKAPIELNPPSGDYNDPDARIWPFKIHDGKQPYDTDNNRILPIYLVGKKGSGALWADYDWPKALQKGAELNHLDEYKGNFDFVETQFFGPIKHMVAPSEDAVSCVSCHSRESRLEGLNDFYLIGRDSNFWIELFGFLGVIGGLFGVMGHGALRYITTRRRNAKLQNSNKAKGE